eukprot:TRINITY_DN850_c0_g1_i3.p2 TRINITY_DN850_c0_g1~~TRINITY_DN850_c0_g1_i3.p2  ORF type:complete len:502 (+),score=130.78 TRINITY_DN850_c0_g1_i3:157-1506(+)
MEEEKKSIPSWAEAIIQHEKHEKHKNRLGVTPSDLEKEVEEEYKRLREEEKRKARGTGSLIPRFFFRPSIRNPIRFALHVEARNRFLQRKSNELLNIGEMEQVFKLLVEHSTPPVVVESERVNYEAFLTVSDVLMRTRVLSESQANEFFTASIFMRFKRDRLGRIGIHPFFNYMMRKVSLMQSRISLAMYDQDCDGFLQEADVEEYLWDSIVHVNGISDLEEVFQQYYVCTAARKFFFFLDPNGTKRIPIRDVVCSDVHMELIELLHGNLSDPEASRNWFSWQTFQRIYMEFQTLDTTKNGLLSRDEMRQFRNGTMTQSFVERLFQEVHTEEGMMDYSGFVDFVLAMENKKHPAALGYFWKIMDVSRTGSLTVFGIDYFFRDILKELDARGQETVSLEDIRDEIFDMVKPKDLISNVFQTDSFLTSGIQFLQYVPKEIVNSKHRQGTSS